MVLRNTSYKLDEGVISRKIDFYNILTVMFRSRRTCQLSSYINPIFWLQTVFWLHHPQGGICHHTFLCQLDMGRPLWSIHCFRVKCDFPADRSGNYQTGWMFLNPTCVALKAYILAPGRLHALWDAMANLLCLSTSPASTFIRISSLFYRILFPFLLSLVKMC